MKTMIASLIAVAGIAGIANAQPYPSNASLAFEAWNGSAWVRNSITLGAGQTRVEVRAVVDYSGPAGSAVALSSLRYQPTLTGADLTGASQDNFAGWRNGGVSGDLIAGSMVSTAEGNDGNALATYGRVGFGSTATNSASFNIITTHRHGGDFPANGFTGAGAALRVAGSFVTQFPGTGEAAATADDINRINRGLVASQSSALIGGNPNPNYRGGLTGIVIFRAAITLGDSTATRVLGTDDWSQARAGSGVGTTDNRRFSLWQVVDSEAIGSLRVDMNHIPLSIVVPSPASMALLGLGGLAAARRRR
jgi:hypothetical protein